MKREPDPMLAARERLERNLENLSFYCSPGFKLGGDAANRFTTSSILRGIVGSYGGGYWPSHELLREIEDDVTVFAMRGRVRPIYPSWKAFEQVDRRLTKLRLKLRVGNLISRARAMLPGESEVNKLLRLAIASDDIQARCSLGDMAMKAEKLDELLEADRQIEKQRFMAEPLAQWTVSLGHPMAKDFVCIARFFSPEPDWRDSHRRILQWYRTRRHRLARKHL
jgi:hypothetical protein